MFKTDDIFASADWYDRGINWEARFGRELPVLADVFGPPEGKQLLDAGCGTGRHLLAMTRRGYQVAGLDLSPAMLALAREHAASPGVDTEFFEAAYVDALAVTGGSPRFDGVYSLGNALASTANLDVAKRSVAGLANVLVPGGKLFIQILNFAKLRDEFPRVRGPRVRVHEGVEYLSSRTYAFVGDQVEVTNVTLWREGEAWRQHAHGGTLAAIAREQLADWCNAAGLTVGAEWGGYDRAAFDATTSNDLIVVATKQ